MLINGFGFSGYRNIGNDLVKIAPLKKINFIIGQNNSGKSNIINFLSEQFPTFTQNVQSNNQFQRGNIKNSFTTTDYPISSSQIQHRIAYCLDPDQLNKFINERLSTKPHVPALKELALRVLSSDEFRDHNNLTWFTYTGLKPGTPFHLEYNSERVKKCLNASEWRNLWGQLTGKTGGNLDEAWIPQTLNSLSHSPTTTPEILVVPAIRKVGSAGSKAEDFSGEGIIDRLSQLQNPPLEQQQAKNKFRDINNFVRTVLDNQEATIEIPYGRDMILVHMDNKTLPLESLGTGVHEVIILAAASTILDNSVLCVEEPELHLHPLLQRKLIHYMYEKTSNQYFFTTHSAHLLDAVDSEIFHVISHTEFTKVVPISKTKQKSEICNDLGYRASDILQSNCIIWVEGPSDRIYLKHWLHHYNSDLHDGIHYSIMFFGGRLFSHLSALDPDESEIDDFISLRSLNRNSVIFFDSDKSSPHAKINKTKIRLKNEFNQGPGFAWITKGREVENYLNEDFLEKSVLSVHPSASQLEAVGQWSNLLKYKKKRTSKVVTANKVEVAKHYVKTNKPDLSILDLEARISELNDFILKANQSL
ncbi:AAA family ATPase [Desulfosediminicola flagellatus]|uniref:AAA family ATPase n=1 Tax=Desulfosediminicola flagellatus TaxID=2569541 RepID=UPI0010ABACA9|nr:ATP-binding protein [Desulfosediminicola flagellatus]